MLKSLPTLNKKHLNLGMCRFFFWGGDANRRTSRQPQSVLKQKMKFKDKDSAHCFCSTTKSTNYVNDSTLDDKKVNRI